MHSEYTSSLHAQFPLYVRFLDASGTECVGQAVTDELKQARRIKGDLAGSFTVTDEVVNVKELLTPVKPSSIIGIGLNYQRHAREINAKPPAYPLVFFKNVNAAVATERPIVIPPLCLNKPQVDYEVELAVIIGKPCFQATRDNAMDYVLGYTIANDVSARWWQIDAGGGQWCFGKSFDSFCPLGPLLVLAKDMLNPQNLRLSTRLNGVVVQDSNTSDMIFSIADLIVHLSQGTTLEPGTVILTGTPEGVGFVRKPPLFLKSGDILELSIEHLGTLKNQVVVQESVRSRL
eukprot:GILK01001273.1.p1 GENE.GILK01001273.1~~GILK01001273.1.p1  ORF type:complete len:301 (+),score=43.57 GILK01001273.1:35-904(+)